MDPCLRGDDGSLSFVFLKELTLSAIWVEARRVVPLRILSIHIKIKLGTIQGWVDTLIRIFVCKQNDLWQAFDCISTSGVIGIQ